ncbi:hypothetical protein RB595_007224 [Gaeumannomyces hyphopodioides]
MAAHLILNSGLGDEITTLLLRLELDDIQQLESRAKGKEPEGSPSDLWAALDDYKREIATHLRRESDRAMALSISRAVRLDTGVIDSHLAEEERATQDRAYALTLLDPGAGAPAAAEGASSTALVVSGAPRCDCVVCGATSAPEGGIRSPCNHDYCRDCLVRLFDLSLRDESLFPPRCCGSIIPLDISRKYIGPELAGRFLARKIEMETPDRTYCHDPRCSRFIPPDFIRMEVGTCVSCAKGTCVVCKAASHQGDCPDDPRTKQLLDLAQEKGWRQCRTCKAMVELAYGCFHMTCVCRAQFCYLCGETWKTCRCAQWDEGRLVARAEAIVGRAPRAHLIAPAQRERLVAAQVQNQRQNHNCRNHIWRRATGAFNCDQCGQHLREYIFECQQCQVVACRRCRLNRLG